MRLSSFMLVASAAFLATCDAISAASDISRPANPANVVGNGNRFLRTHKVTEGQENKFADEDSDDEDLNTEERVGLKKGFIDYITKKFAEADDSALKSVRAEQKSEMIKTLQIIKDQGNTPQTMKNMLKEGFAELTDTQGDILLKAFTKYFDRLN
ncbi:hypothetical protein PHYBOEH_005435 [Phytophthora boehmeriae]|uniref:RxLR effector protein n=1 Tax=Phytophthora boehmeriae TaxID=109152 RepID=A0A8T1WM39_9STRA|nr:hypothetical protein PHYBOEH_005435 [Phytophthora boehmeriae]